MSEPVLHDVPVAAQNHTFVAEHPSAKSPLHTSYRDFTFAITLLALVLRLLVAFVVARTLTAQWLFSQATELSCLANSLLQGHGLSSPFCGQTGPSAFLAPGYPMFVAMVFRVFGPYTMHSATCIVFTQAFFATATVPMTMWAARRAFGTHAANLAGLLTAVNPWLIGLEAVLWESSLSILLMTALLGLAILLMQQATRARLYIAASILASAVFVNPSLVLTGLSMLVAALLLQPKPPRRVWLGPLLTFLAVCSFWPARNYKVLQTFIPLRSNMGYELWQGNRPEADGFFQAKLHPNVNAAQYERYKALGEIAYMSEKSTMAHIWIKSHPRRFAALTLKRMFCFWTGVGRTPSVSIIGSTVILSLAGLAALHALFRKDRKLAVLFTLPLLLLPLPYYISHPDFRFWCLLAPVLTMLASWWAVSWFAPHLQE